jgi:2-polyprenyl-3-methyl-5-hydroxy-6-metoxy-1,4-benzoquinol methylase
MSAPATTVQRVQLQTRREPTGRQALIWQLLAGSLDAPSRDHAAEVLDCGGGSGTFAVPIAQTGAVVTVVDISIDALATLRRRADDAGVGDRVNAVQGDVEALAESVGAATFDLVLAHGILGAVDDVPAVFAAIAARVRPGGRLSVLVENPVAGVLARAMAGDLAAALQELHAVTAGTGPLGPDSVRALCDEQGLRVEAEHGIGVFGDLVPGRALDAPGAREALEQLESASAAHAPFRDIAARVHLLARRPAG